MYTKAQKQQKEDRFFFAKYLAQYWESLSDNWSKCAFLFTFLSGMLFS